MKNHSSKPNIFDYLDILSFLQDYYHWRKSISADFSYEAWSDELDFKSRSYIRMVVMGKRKVSDTFVEAFGAQSIEGKEEREYFSYLVKYSQADSQQEKKAFSSKMLQILRTKNNQSILDADTELISNPKLLRLYTILGFKDILLSMSNLMQIMGLSEEELSQYLGKLQDFDLIEKVYAEEPQWRAKHEKFKIPDDKGNMNLMRFHELSLYDAIDAFTKPKNLRKYKSILVPLTEEELVEIYSNIEEFTAEQISRYSPSEYKGRRLFQMNLNILPVAEEIA